MKTAFAFAALLVFASPAAAQSVVGFGRVIDSDTLYVGAAKIRLGGLDGPEWNMPGGVEATTAMRSIISGQVLRCEPDGSRTYDRLVARCFLPNGDDIAARLVAKGLARDCYRYSKGRYAALERPEVGTIPAPYCMPRHR